MPDETDDQLDNEGALDGLSDQQKDGSEDEKTEDQGMDGQVSAENAADAVDTGSDTEAEAPPEEEPVGADRQKPRIIKKMSASDFKVRPKPKPELVPEPKQEPVPEPKQEPVSKPSDAERINPQPEPPGVDRINPQPEPPGVEKASPQPEPKPLAAAPAKPEQKRNSIPSSKPPMPSSVPEQMVLPKFAPRSAPRPAPEPIKEPTPEPEPVKEPIPELEPIREPIQEEPVVAEPFDNRPVEEPKEQEEERKEKKRRPEPEDVDAAAGGPIDAIRGVLSFFTILPIHVGGKEIGAMNKNLYLIPIAGLLIGMIATAVGILFNELRLTVMAPIAVLASIYVMSKFLHFDGLADFGDGMMAGGDREDCIKALKDTRIGAGGLGIALITILATVFGLLGIWGPFAIAAVIVIMEVFVKNAMVAAAAFGEPGTGMASEQVRSANMTTMLISTGISAGIAFAGYLLMGVVTSFIVATGMLNSTLMISAALIIAGAAVSSILIGWLMAYLSNKKFGFVNGDVLGATNEVARVLILIVATIVIMFYTVPDLLWPLI
ncbi:MAG: adenosylcobinamide-GDP ribazoletransferase [Candidatus Methanoplasma sp.]|jgi:adenosylcobinamide-GDP ribazoletransferase|nr:adenosylcobinamide-GDP ribazoletransferase [Candidatus Methanoplasma sp.]